MKKKNLIILLIIPFLISLLGIVTINMTFSTFNSDISSIEWYYSDVEAFQISNDIKFSLHAKGVTTSTAPLAPGNDLVWTVENKDSSIEEPLAEIQLIDGAYYLVPFGEGEVVVTCSNEKGNVFRKMTVVLYEKGVIIVQPVISTSQSNIDSKIYYGEYDLDYKTNVKEQAIIDFKMTCYPNDLLETLEFVDVTNNIEITRDEMNLKVQITNTNTLEASFTVKTALYEDIKPYTYSFNVVPDGVNVYDYQTLLACTNKSKQGEIVVLRKSFEAYDFVKNTSSNNATTFGNFNGSDEYDYRKDVYYYKTTYNTEYIRQWNSFAYSNKQYKEVDPNRVAALRVQKDFYGNGYTLNFHDLIYPSQKTNVNVDGKDFYVPTLGPDDLYRGPLPFYSLGNPNSLPLVTSFGQDNSGMYVDGDNVLLNDVIVKNCNTPDSLSFFDTTGVVVEIAADNVTIKNSRLQNGKNVLRSFSSMNLNIDNSLLSNSMNFLITTGSNEFVKIDEKTLHSFVDIKGNSVKTTVENYLNVSSSGGGNEILNSYLKGTYSDLEDMATKLKAIQNALNSNVSSIASTIKGSMKINNTYFYNSGLAAICLETLFNGTYLYSASPSEISSMFDTASGILGGGSLVPYTPTNVSGISYPVTIDITGNTKFYDYKIARDIDLSGLIDENISTIISNALDSMGLESKIDINIDTIFPLKTVLVSNATQQSCIYKSGDDSYINIPIVYYGGGINLSTVNIQTEEYQDRLSTIDIDFLNEYLPYQSTGSTLSDLQGMMLKSVTLVTGFEPFKFVCVKDDGYLFGSDPNVSDLIANAKGE